ncbi:hypothetical protein J6590_009986 [Homalodisca vitripennis]|nr:hypothetical protein J6590_009986 [Homalodisca vitripennis]
MKTSLVYWRSEEKWNRKVSVEIWMNGSLLSLLLTRVTATAAPAATAARTGRLVQDHHTSHASDHTAPPRSGTDCGDCLRQLNRALDRDRASKGLDRRICVQAFPFYKHLDCLQQLARPRARDSSGHTSARSVSTRFQFVDQRNLSSSHPKVIPGHNSFLPAPRTFDVNAPSLGSGRGRSRAS